MFGPAESTRPARSYKAGRRAVPAVAEDDRIAGTRAAERGAEGADHSVAGGLLVQQHRERRGHPRCLGAAGQHVTGAPDVVGAPVQRADAAFVCVDANE